MNLEESNNTIDDGFKAPIDNHDEIPGVKAALILGIISIVAAGGGIPGIVLSIIAKNKVAKGKEVYYSNPEKYEKDKKTLFGAEKCAKIGMLIAIPMTIVVVVLNVASTAMRF